MPTPTNTWHYVAGLAIIGWALLSVFTALRMGKVQDWWAWILAVAGTGFTFAAGCYALNTFIADWTSRLMGWSWLRFAAFIYVMVSLVLLVAGLIPDKFLAAALTTNTAIFALLLPSLLLANAVPGEFGSRVEETTREAQQQVQQGTAGWFG
jgi:MFS family permease